MKDNKIDELLKTIQILEQESSKILKEKTMNAKEIIVLQLKLKELISKEAILEELKMKVSSLEGTLASSEQKLHSAEKSALQKESDLNEFLEENYELKEKQLK